MQQQQSGQQLAQPQFTFEGGHLVMYHKEATGLQTKDATINDADRMSDVLNTEKHLTDEYNIAMNEASHDALYQVLKQNDDKCHQLQRQLFNIMFKKGWYKLPVADAQSVAAAFNKFQQYKAQYPFPQKSQQQSATQAVSSQVTATTQSTTTRTAQVSVRSTSTAAKSAGAANPDQAIQQKVSQALGEAERGQVPTGYTGH
ncbi:MAG TPA: spore coat protein [Symbiobacteriaceae bacterium]|jgi:spore coat protein CotF|nr:spore coat protein [Symbiobacteriaceae bacterium]